MHTMPKNLSDRRWLPYLLLLTLALAAFGVIRASAFTSTQPKAQASPFHPDFPLLDENSQNVLNSGGPLSTTETCGACHDTEFIALHSFHSTDGLSTFGTSGRGFLHAWDLSDGFFGRWDPLTYRYLTPEGDELFDLGTAAWIQTVGLRHVGGGPAQVTLDGVSLSELTGNESARTKLTLNQETGELERWDWVESGTVEMNCFLCHIETPNAAARDEAIRLGDFRWANTWTLLGSGRLDRADGTPVWDPEAFDRDGNALQSKIGIQDPTNDNCGICHGLTEQEVERPLSFESCLSAGRRTATTGQVVSPQRISDSGLNLANKGSLDRAWDVHAERLVECTDCHYSLNNPVHSAEGEADRPEHLQFDPRRLELGEYLYQPLHDLARAGSSESLASEVGAGIENCESCHALDNTHQWLPYSQRHFEAMACETCHIPALYGGGLQFVDWTVYAEGPRTLCRVNDREPGADPDLMTGYQPILLPSAGPGGEIELTPLNLVSTWYWVQGNPARPVRVIDLQRAWQDGSEYAEEVVDAFDQNGDRELSPDELAIVSEGQVATIAGRLEGLGLENPRIVGEVWPIPLHHSVIGGEWAIRDCSACHGQNSRVAEPFALAQYTPGGEQPRLLDIDGVLYSGELRSKEEGKLFFEPDPAASGFYVFGRDSVPWVDWTGVVVFLVVLLGISTHSGLRLVHRERAEDPEEVHTVYMYGFYERLWHWLQTIVICALLFTGLVIHKPEILGFLSFRYIVLVHNILAGILVVNAGLALFYHLASGEIRQFLPRPVGFFDQAIVQARFYLGGIFLGEPHPFAKTPQSKLNPLQQITYLGILNVFLPLQILTGILMWGAQQWPEIASRVGGLPFLAPFHSLVAWFFAAFIVAHVYLTTTAGPRPLSSIKAMMLGWEEVEATRSPGGE
jgi:thiosulfate reductase cytochrome b subunit